VNSIGIWWDRIRNGTSEPQIHLDLNLWAAKQTENNYIEFGFKIKEYAIINKLYIFLPFQFSKNDFEDKTRYFFDSQDLSCLLFNQEMTFVGNGSSSYKKIKYHLADNANSGDFTKADFFYCILNSDWFNFEDIKDNNKVVGTKLSIDINKIQNKNMDVIYFRFRIKKLINLYKATGQNNFIIEGLIKKLALIEINVNSVRKLPRVIVDEIFTQSIKIHSMNLFIMTNVTTNLIFDSNSKDYVNARRLEYLWKDYVDKTVDNSHDIANILAYQWKKKDFFSYAMLAKIEYSVIDYYLFSIMLLGIIVFSMVGSIISGGRLISIIIHWIFSFFTIFVIAVSFYKIWKAIFRGRHI